LLHELDELADNLLHELDKLVFNLLHELGELVFNFLHELDELADILLYELDELGFKLLSELHIACIFCGYTELIELKLRWAHPALHCLWSQTEDVALFISGLEPKNLGDTGDF
jgi:hypothetical protein